MGALMGAVMGGWAALKWLLTPVGRVFGLVGLLLILVLAVFARGRRAGVESMRARQRKDTIQRLETRAHVEENNRRRPADERRDRLRGWAGDD